MDDFWTKLAIVLSFLDFKARNQKRELAELVELETEFVEYKKSVGYPLEEILPDVDARVRHLFKEV